MLRKLAKATPNTDHRYMYLFSLSGRCPSDLFLSIESHYQSAAAFGRLVCSFLTWFQAWYFLFQSCYALIRIRSIPVSMISPGSLGLWPVRLFVEPRRSLCVQCMKYACTVITLRLKCGDVSLKLIVQSKPPSYFWHNLAHSLSWYR